MPPRNLFDKKADELNLELGIKRFSQSTRTAQEAADALGCTVGQIGKSLMFKTIKGQIPLLCVTSGKNRVDEKKLSDLAGEEIEKADAKYIKEMTGYVIGGVPPFGYKNNILTFVDEDLLEYPEVWVAAGEVNAVFPMNPKKLVEITGAKTANVKIE